MFCVWINFVPNVKTDLYVTPKQVVEHLYFVGEWFTSAFILFKWLAAYDWVKCAEIAGLLFGLWGIVSQNKISKVCFCSYLSKSKSCTVEGWVLQIMCLCCYYHLEFDECQVGLLDLFSPQNGSGCGDLWLSCNGQNHLRKLPSTDSLMYLLCLWQNPGPCVSYSSHSASQLYP